MKKFLLLFLSACICLSFTACSGKKAPKEIDMDSMADYMLNNLTFSEELTRLEPDVVSWRYRVSDDVDAIVYAGSGATAEEFGVFKAKDADEAETVNSALKQHLQDMNDSFKDYIPEEVKKLDKAYLETSGCYVMFAVSCDDDISSIMDNYDSEK